MRTDPQLRARVRPVSRDDAEATFRQAAAGELPDETMVRSYFCDYQPFPNSVPWRLSTVKPPEGFVEQRVYRILFAKDLTADGVAELANLWRMALASDWPGPQTRVVGTANAQLPGHVFTWNLRRIGPGIAWCLDVTAQLENVREDVLGEVLWQLRTAMRRQGLIPVTIERFS